MKKFLKHAAALTMLIVVLCACESGNTQKGDAVEKPSNDGMHMHIYVDECAQYCSSCNEYRETTTPHSYSSECDCECNACGDTKRVTSMDHSYDDGGVCSRCCDVSAIDATPHLFSSDCDVECNYCGHRRKTIAMHEYENGICIFCSIEG